MIARDALMDRLDGVLANADIATGVEQLAVYAGASHYLIARCDDVGDSGFANVVTSNWPFDLVRTLGFRLMREQAKVNEVERCLSTLTPTLFDCDESLCLQPGIGRRCCVIPFNSGPARMILGFLFREGIVLSRERLGDTALMAAYLVDSGTDMSDGSERRPLDLTEREIECLAWIAEGKTSEEVSMIIGISRNTVNNYITSIMRKTATRTRSEAIALAVRNRLI